MIAVVGSGVYDAPKRLLGAVMRRAGIADGYRLYDTMTQEQYNALKPPMVVTLGSSTFNTFLGYLSHPPKNAPSLPNARGYFFDAPHGKILPTIHPTDVIREWVPWRPLFEWDWKKVSRERSLGYPPFPDRWVEIGGMDRLAQELDSAKWIAIDIENTADLQLACLGVAVSPHKAYVLPAHDTAAIEHVLRHPVGKVLQNGMYDRFFLSQFVGVDVKNVVFDTMLAWHTLMPELAGLRDDANRVRRMRRKTHKGLRFLASVYTRDRFWKDYDFDDESERFRLCGLDCCITLDIAEQQHVQLQAASASAGEDQVRGLSEALCA